MEQDKRELSELEKQVFKDAAWRRKQAGIKLKRLCIMLSEHHAHTANNIWSMWCETLGKAGAEEYFIVSMIKAHEALRRARAIQRPTTKD